MTDTESTLYDRHPDLGLLMTDGSALIGAALDPGMTLSSDVRTVQVRFSPGRSALAQYQAALTRGETTTTETFVASIGRRVPPETAVVSAKGYEVAIWRVPHDPFLPGLAPVSHPQSAAGLLTQLGVDSTDLRLRRMAYRPGRRAVMELTTPRDRVFAKVVRPAKVATLQGLHTELSERAPIPVSLGWSSETGIAMLQALSGHSLRQAVEMGSADLPGAGSVVGLLDTLGEHTTGTEVRPSLVDRVQEHAVFLATIDPEGGERVGSIASSIVEHAQPQPTRTIHGDFHASQIMVQGKTITGLVDIDTVGMGERADDFANLLGHLTSLGASNTAASARVEAYGAHLIRGFDSLIDPRQLRLRVAASLLGYARGPFRVQEPGWLSAVRFRVALAEQWLAAALSIGSP